MYYGKSPEFRAITEEEILFFIAVWKSYIQGSLHDFPTLVLEGEQNIQIPDWATCIKNYANFRYPLLDNGLSRYVQTLLKFLMSHQKPINVRRLVGDFLGGFTETDLDSYHTNLPIKTYLDDIMIFGILHHLSSHPKLVEITPIENAKGNYTNTELAYPWGKFNIQLTELGKAVVMGNDKVDLNHIELLRWWGSKDIYA